MNAFFFSSKLTYLLCLSGISYGHFFYEFPIGLVRETNGDDCNENRKVACSLQQGIPSTMIPNFPVPEYRTKLSGKTLVEL